MKTISPAQEVALARLAPLLGPDYFLVGGVAVAARLGHRVSHDLDLFTQRAEPEELTAVLAALPHVRISSRAASTLHLEVDGIPTSLIRYSYPLLAASEHLPGFAVPVASVDDLIAMKLSAIANRGAARDFWDLHTMLVSEARALPAALELFSAKFSSEDIGHVVRALCYFGDAESAPLPRGLEQPQWWKIQDYFCVAVRAL